VLGSEVRLADEDIVPPVVGHDREQAAGEFD
jgi:hypothetical protein